MCHLTSNPRLACDPNSTCCNPVWLLLLQVSRFLSGCGFDFVGARVLTGTEEGLLGWVALNYASGALQVTRRREGEGGR